MYRLLLLALLVPFSSAVAKDHGGDFDACRKQQVEVAAKAADFHGEARIKQLIDLDIQRAHREEMEGDADECLEAVDHAYKLMRGEY